jgi:nucleotide-binding universal stress UspA family protein
MQYLTEDDFMFKKIVVAYDGSENSSKALDRAIELAKCNNAELHVVGVVRIFEFGAIDYISPEEIEEYEKQEISKEEKYLKEAIQKVSQAGLNGTYKVMEGDPAEEIMTYADEIGSDLIVVGRRGVGGFKRLLIGSKSSNIVKYANQSVLVVK